MRKRKPSVPKGKERSMKPVTIEYTYNQPSIQWVDVRSPKEYREDHIPTSINFPVLTDEERHEVGVLYKSDKEQAKALAFRYGEEKRPHLDKLVNDLVLKGNTLGFYCFRGGLRSTIPAKLYHDKGFPVMKLQGGYKAYRRFVMKTLDAVSEDTSFVVLHGYTGAGKSEALALLEEAGYPVLHLEALAKNGGSLFGDLLYDVSSPSQKHFESLLLHSLYPFQGKRVFVEMESRRIGRLTLPEPLYRSISHSPRHILMDTRVENRIHRIMGDYLPKEAGDHPDFSAIILDKLTLFKKSLGSNRVSEMSKLVHGERYPELVEILLKEHYDPLYRKSVESYREVYKLFHYSNLQQELLPWLRDQGFLQEDDHLSQAAENTLDKNCTFERAESDH